MTLNYVSHDDLQEALDALNIRIPIRAYHRNEQGEIVIYTRNGVQTYTPPGTGGDKPPKPKPKPKPRARKKTT